MGIEREPQGSCPMRALSEIDPFDPAILSSPDDYFNRLRVEAPVHQVALPGVSGPVFFVTRRRDILDVCRQPELFASRPLPEINRWPEQPAEFREVFGDEEFASTFVTSDAPEHRQYRRVAEAGLSLRKVKAWREMLLETIDELVSDFPDGEVFDFVDAFSVKLPSEVIRKILGLPATDANFLIWLSNEFVAMIDPSVPLIEAIEHARAIKKAQDYLLPLIEAYRREPKDNFCSVISNSRRDDGELMSMAETFSMVLITIIGGNETTRNALSSAALYLTSHPDVWTTLKKDPSLISAFVDEAIRLASPSNFLPRTVTADTELSGVKIPTGATLFLFWSSGNRDPTFYTNPLEFNLTRSNARDNLTFGRGPHLCPGNHLARSEITLTVERLLSNFDSIELAQPAHEIRYEPILAVRALGKLLVRIKRRNPAV